MKPIIRTASTFFALALTASVACADPISYDFSSTVKNTGGFTQIYDLPLGTGAYFNGTLTTTTTGNAANLSIYSILLSNGSSQYRFDTLGDGHDFTAISSSTTTSKIGFITATNYLTTYSWDPVFLAAGDWTISIVGNEVDGKFGGKLALQLVDPPAGNVPEPATLALAAIALVGMGVAGRRRNRNT